MVALVDVQKNWAKHNTEKLTQKPTGEPLIKEVPDFLQAQHSLTVVLQKDTMKQTCCQKENQRGGGVSRKGDRMGGNIAKRQQPSPLQRPNNRTENEKKKATKKTAGFFGGGKGDGYG